MLPSPDEFEIAVDALSQLMSDEGNSIRLVDCREEDEFALCKIVSATLLPLSRFAELAEPALSDERESPIVVYCHHGMRSQQATQYLRSRGFPQTWSLAGGIDAWSQEIDPAVPRY